jgi:hypothetical protein
MMYKFLGRPHASIVVHGWHVVVGSVRYLYSEFSHVPQALDVSYMCILKRVKVK